MVLKRVHACPSTCDVRRPAEGIGIPRRERKCDAFVATRSADRIPSCTEGMLRPFYVVSCISGELVNEGGILAGASALICLNIYVTSFTTIAASV